MIRILLTGAGAPGTPGTVYSLRNNPKKEKVWILGTDIREDCVGKYICDAFETAPAPEDPLYFAVMEKLCKKYKVNVLIPQTTREVRYFSKHKKDFNNVVVGREDPVDWALDKWLTMTTFDDVFEPKHAIVKNREELCICAKELGYPKKPLIIKPMKSNGSRGVRLIKEPKQDFLSYVSTKPNTVEVSLKQLTTQLGNLYPQALILMEYLPGREYSVDCYRGSFGDIAISRKRSKIVNGIAFETVIDRVEEIEDASISAMRRMSLMGLAGFQFIQNERGMFKIIECNPRVQGTMVASTLAGRNIIWNAVEDTLYGKTKEQRGKVKNIVVGRYWGAYSKEGVV